MFNILFGWISPDIVNAIFEGVSSLFILLSIIRLHKDKEVVGVPFFYVLFFWLWGAWNVFYYTHLDQIASFIGALAVITMNSVWAGMLVYYKKNSDKYS